VITRDRGFTLVEVLVALAVFAMLAALAYGTLSQTLANAEVLTERMERLQAVQRTFRYLGQDFMQLAPRPIRDELGDNFVPALRTDPERDHAVELTHGGWSNPAGLPRSTLQRVAYRLEDEALLRYHWTVLDRTLDNEPLVEVLLDGIDGITMRFLHANGEWSEEWPVSEPPAPQGLRLRPRAVEVVLRFTDETEITRLLEVAP
jgi:general secretion pathway protein J